MSVSDIDVSDIDLMPQITDADLCPHDARFRAARDNLSTWQYRILRIGAHLNEAEYNDRHMSHPTWGLYICDRPGMYLERHGKRYPVNHEAITLFPPWVGYHYRFPKQHSSGHAYIHVDIPRLPSALIHSQFKDIYAITNPYVVKLMWDWARRFSTEDIDEMLLALEAQNIASQVFTEFLLGLSPQQQHAIIHPGKNWQRLQPAIRHINNQLSQNIAIGDLADILQCTNEHCIRLFKKHLGQTPTQYILTRRVEAAAELLISSEKDIDSIAIQCGFPNRQYLSRVFKKHMWTSPAKYRDMR